MDAIGCDVTAVRRRGKYLIVDLDDSSESGCELVIHLGMTGRLAVESSVGSVPPSLAGLVAAR